MYRPGRDKSCAGGFSALKAVGRTFGFSLALGALQFSIGTRVKLVTTLQAGHHNTGRSRGIMGLQRSLVIVLVLAFAATASAGRAVRFYPPHRGLPDAPTAPS